MRFGDARGQAMLEYVVVLMAVALAVAITIRRMAAAYEGNEQNLRAHYADGRN